MTVRVRAPVAVLLSRFPLVTETFILREIVELERQGQPVVLVPMIREHPPVIHDEAKPWLDRAWFTPWISWAIVVANLRALVERPARMFALLSWILGGALLHPSTLVRSLLLFPKSVYLAVLLRREGIAQIHAHFATHPSTMAVIISALSGIPFSFTVHAHDIFIDRTLLRRKLAEARFIRAISAFNKRFLENLYPREVAGKIRVVHVGIDPKLYRAAAPPRNRVPVVQTIAALKPYKGVPFLVGACRILSDRGREFTCDIIGTGPMRNAVRRAIVRGGLHDRVRMRGALPQHVVAGELRRADVFVLPSVIASDGQMEGIPVALMEAMAAEKPVVTTAISGIPELVEHGVSGLLVDPANPRQLADAIELLVGDASLCRRLGENARRKVEAEFDIRKCVAELLRLLDAEVEPLGGEISRAVRAVAVEDTVYGLRAARRGADAAVYEILSSNGTLREMIVKEHLARSGESRPPAVRARDEYAVLDRLASHFAGSDILGVPHPIAVRDGIVAMSRARGAPLTNVIRGARASSSSTLLRDAVHHAGRWLDRFQRFESGDGGEALERIVSRALRDADLAGAGARVRNRIRSLGLDLERRGTRAVAHHGDFWPGNIFVAADGGIDVIDFEGYSLSLPAHDINYFLLHASLYFALRGAALMDTVREAFFSGYGESLDPEELALCRLATALQLAARDDRGIPFAQRIVRRRALQRELSR